MSVRPPSWPFSDHRRKQSQDFRSQPLPPTAQRARWSRRPLFLIILPFLFIVLLLFHYHHTLWSAYLVPTHEEPPPLTLNPPSPPSPPSPPPLPPYHPLRFLQGPPTELFRDNLLPEYKYATGWIGGGWTNDWMTFVSLIYLAHITNRIPIIGPFAPTHVGSDNEAGFVPFGDVFDVARLAEALRLPVLEWRDVKKPGVPGGSRETFGGWSAWSRWDSIRQGFPRGNHLEANLSLEVSYTPVHAGAKLPVQDAYSHVSLLELSRLAYRPGREAALRESPEPFVSEGPNAVRLQPDHHLLCIDFLYYGVLLQPFEWDAEYFLPWTQVGTHIHWNPRVTSLAQEYLVRLFQVYDKDQIPLFISIHLRHGDFKSSCAQDVAPKDCFTPLSAVAVRVDEIQAELGARPQFQGPEGEPTNLPVIMTSDERDPAWWDEVRSLGWLFIDHGPDGEDTGKKLGPWYPVFIDAAIQSMGHGFVGTWGSTMSVVSQRRVEDWQGGATRLVRFGYPGADNHEPQLTTEREHVNRFQ